MRQDLESAMKNALDGKFYSFVQSNIGTTFVSVKDVPVNYMPAWYTETIPVENRGGWRKALFAKRRVKFWTPERIAKLKVLHRQGVGAKKLELIFKFGRTEIEMQMNKMGLTNKNGRPYK